MLVATSNPVVTPPDRKVRNPDLSVRRLLSNVHFYVALQKGLGADRLRRLALEVANIQPGDSVLDVGCGPAYYLDQLPSDAVYQGFDTHEPYLAFARQRWPHATFHHGVFNEDSLPESTRFDVVLLLGLLHHVDDAEAASLLALCARRLAPGGRVISADTAYVAGQNRVARWVADNDRGEYVRAPSEYRRLAATAFGQVDGLVIDVMRIPTSMWLMTSERPRNAAGVA